jgi:hypothetical protein
MRIKINNSWQEATPKRAKNFILNILSYNHEMNNRDAEDDLIKDINKYYLSGIRAEELLETHGSW